MRNGKWEVEINWLAPIIWIITGIALIKTWATPLFWVVLVIFFNDMKFTTIHKSK